MQEESNGGVFDFGSDITDEQENDGVTFEFDSDLSAEDLNDLSKELPFVMDKSSFDFDDFDELNDELQIEQEDVPNTSTSLVQTIQNKITILDVENAIENVTSNNKITLNNLESSIAGTLSSTHLDVESRLTAFMGEGVIPSFIKEKDIAILINEFTHQSADLTDDDFINDIVSKFNLSPEILGNSASMIELKMFLNNALRRINFNLATTVQDIDDLGNRTKSIMKSLVNSNDLQLDLNESSTAIITKALITPNSVSLVCDCGSSVISTDNIITLVRTSGNLSFCCAKLVCPKCGKSYILDNSGIKRLIDSVDDKVLNLQGLHSRRSKSNDVLNVLTYSPSYSELSDAFPGVFDFIVDKHGSKKVISVDLEEMKRLAREKNSLFFSKHSIDSYAELGVKSIAKIVSGTCNSYSNLKERAIASLLQEFESTRLSSLSRVDRAITKLPLLYRDNYDGFERDLSSCFITDSIDPETGNLDKTRFDYDFNNYLNILEDTDKDAYLFVDQLYKYSKIFSSLTITNLPLSQDLIDRYLGDEKVFKCVDYLTDLMIISNLSESFLTNFSPRRREGDETGRQADIKRIGSAKREASYSASIRDILDVNKMSDTRPLQHLVEYFFKHLVQDSNRTLPNLSVQEFSLFYSDDPEFYNLVYKFAKHLLDADYYEAYLNKVKLETEYKPQLNKMLGIILNSSGTVSELGDEFILRDDLKDLAKLIMDTPVIDTKQFPTKFSYYFRSEDSLSDEEQIELMKLFNKLKITPKCLKGDNFAEKIEYYKSLIDNPSETVVDEQFKNLVDRNYILLISLINLSKTQPVKFTLFMLARDLLVLFRKISFIDICSCLYLNQDIAGFYLTDDFNFTVNKIDNSIYLEHLFFKSEELISIVRDDKLSLHEKKVELESSMALILKDFIKLPEVFEIIKDFLANTFDGEEDM